MLVSCGENAETDTTTETDESGAVEHKQEEKMQAEEEVADTVRLEIHGNDQMQYNKDRLQVKAGQVVVLTLKHVGEMPKTAMGHNWVLLTKGTDRASFAEDAVNAKDNDYIPESRSGDIIAHTGLVGGGETTEVTFEAPAKGIYDYICSFPGHYVKMHGKFIVQ